MFLHAITVALKEEEEEEEDEEEEEKQNKTNQTLNVRHRIHNSPSTGPCHEPD